MSMLSVAYSNDNFAYLNFSNYLPISMVLNSFLDHNSAPVRNVLMIDLMRITEQISDKCRMQE